MKACRKGHTYSSDKRNCPECALVAQRAYKARNRERVNATQRRYRKETLNARTKEYEKTPNGFLMRAYRNMESRVTGIQKTKAHLYAGLSICDREEFYEWSRDDPDFWRLYRAWVASGYDRKLSPSVNRIDTGRGYELGNIEWVTHSVNSALAGQKKKSHLYRALREVADSVAA